MALAECVVKTAAGRIPVMVHVGATTTADAVTLVRHAEHVGADAVSSVAPIYYSHGAEAIFQHCHRIGAATGLPLYVYHLSIVHQAALSPIEYTCRLLELPNIAGMKLTDRDMYMLGLIEAYGGKRLRIFSGADEIVLSAVLIGAIGAIGTFLQPRGPICDRAWAAFTVGNLAAGQIFMRRFRSGEGHPTGSWRSRRRSTARFPLFVGVVGRVGDLGQDIQAREQPRTLIITQVADVADAPLAERFGDEQGEQRLQGRDLLRAGRPRIGDGLRQLEVE